MLPGIGVIVGTSIAIHRINWSCCTHSSRLPLPATLPRRGLFFGSFISHSHCLWLFPEMALVQEEVLSAARAHGCFANTVALWDFFAEEEDF
jgi:hypothetical protein